MDQTLNREASSLFWDESVCVEKIIWVAGQTCHASSEFSDFLDSYIDDAEDLLGIKIDGNDENFDPDEVAAQCVRNNKQGFLVQLSTPAPIKFDSDGGHSFTWGHTNTKWFYAECMSEIPKLSKAFAEQIIKNAKNRQSK